MHQDEPPAGVPATSSTICNPAGPHACRIFLCALPERYLNGDLSIGSKLPEHSHLHRTITLRWEDRQMHRHMNKQHEKLLVATLAGLIITAAAAFAVQPAMAAGYHVEQPARVAGVAWWDHLNVRKWPASYSQKVGEFEPNTAVWVERCNIIPGSSDWCLVERGNLKGWVNSRYLEKIENWDL